MPHSFSAYQIHIGNSNNYPNKFVAHIEEFYNVSVIIDHPEDAEELLKPLFEKEIKRLVENNEEIPLPGSGKAIITLADDTQMQTLKSFATEFWQKIFENDYENYFVRDGSILHTFEMIIIGEEKAIIKKVKEVYNVDISKIYFEPIPVVFKYILKKKVFGEE